MFCGLRSLRKPTSRNTSEGEKANQHSYNIQFQQNWAARTLDNDLDAVKLHLEYLKGFGNRQCPAIKDADATMHAFSPVHDATAMAEVESRHDLEQVGLQHTRK